MRRVFKMLRGESSLLPILEDGELCYSTDEDAVYCGNGKDNINNLQKLTSIAKSPSGKLFGVWVDDDGNARAKELSVRIPGAGLCSCQVDSFKESMGLRARRFAEKECQDCNRSRRLESDYCRAACPVYARNINLYVAIASEQRDADLDEFKNITA